jgi:hypothetical protein
MALSSLLKEPQDLLEVDQKDSHVLKEEQIDRHLGKDFRVVQTVQGVLAVF